MDEGKSETLRKGKRRPRGDITKYQNIEGQLRGRQPEREVGSFMEVEPIKRNDWEHHVDPI